MPETLYVSASDGVRLAVERSGSGPPLYALHGGPANDRRGFGNYLAPIAAYRELCLLDQRGCGESDDAAPATYTLVRLAEDIEDTRAGLGHEMIALLGHSFGGPLALAYASRWAHRVQGLILVSAPVRGLRGVFSSPAAWPLWGRFLLEGLKKDPNWIELTLNHELGNKAKREELRTLMERSIRYDPRRYRPLIRSASRAIDLRAVLKAGVRISGMYGKRDRRFLESARYLRSLGAEVHLIEASGHMPFVEQPQKYHQIVKKLLSAVSGERIDA